MDICKRLNASLDCFSEVVGRIRLRQTHHRPHICQQVFGSVFGLASENNNLSLVSLLLSNISGNLYSTDDFPFRTLDRRDGQRNVDQTSVFAPTNGLKIVDPATAPHTLENCVLLTYARPATSSAE